jgi:hypothetical protein
VAAENNPDREKYVSSDGPIFIDRRGDLVLISESFDDELAVKLIDAAQKQAVEDSKPTAVARQANH